MVKRGGCGCNCGWQIVSVLGKIRRSLTMMTLTRAKKFERSTEAAENVLELSEVMASPRVTLILERCKIRGVGGCGAPPSKV